MDYCIKCDTYTYIHIIYAGLAEKPQSDAIRLKDAKHNHIDIDDEGLITLRPLVQNRAPPDLRKGENFCG